MTVVLDQSLTETVLSLTDTGGDEFDPAELLYVLTTACVRLLDVDAAAVLLVDEDDTLVPVAATHDITDQLEKLQILERQGPCLECVGSGAQVSSAELAIENDRWPEFVRLAGEEGFRSVHAQPLALRGEVVGALGLLRCQAGLLGTEDRRDAEQLATAAAIGLLHRRALHHLETVKEQLQHALESRIDIEQAKGALVERHGLTPAAAFEQLRRTARQRRIPVRELAREVIGKPVDLR